MTRNWQLVAFLLAGSIIAAGCSKKSGGVATNPTPAPAVSQDNGPPLTEEECKKFAAAVEAAVTAPDGTQLDGLLGLESLVGRSISDLGAPPQFMQGIKQGAKSGLQQANFGAKIRKMVEGGGSYKFLRVHWVDQRPRVLFRMLQTEGGINYHDIVVARFPDGRVAMEDMYIFMTGEMLSQTFRRLFIPFIAESDHGLLARLKGSDKTYTENMPRMGTMSKAAREGRHAEALSIYRALPAALQQDKSVLIVYLLAAHGVGDNEYIAAMSAFRNQFPDDACVDFISIDYYVLKKQYDDALGAIDRVNKGLGGDPYLDVMYANTLLTAERFAEARAAAEKAIKAEPTLADAYWSRITVSLKEKNFKDTQHWLRQVVEKCGVEIDDLKTVPEYAGFVKSPQYQEWLKWQKERAKGKP